MLIDKGCQAMYNPTIMVKIKAVIKYTQRCSKCQHEWETESEHPRQCPKCWSRRWDGVDKDAK